MVYTEAVLDDGILIFQVVNGGSFVVSSMDCYLYSKNCTSLSIDLPPDVGLTRKHRPTDNIQLFFYLFSPNIIVLERTPCNASPNS